MQRIQTWQGIILATLLGSGSGMGGTVLYLNKIAPDELLRIARPDPATGTELRAIQRELQYHLHNHPDVINRFDRRISRLEAQVELLRERRTSP